MDSDQRSRDFDVSRLQEAKFLWLCFWSHLGLAVYMYYALRLSFSKRIPGEAVIAIASLSLSSIASIALLSIVHEPWAVRAPLRALLSSLGSSPESTRVPGPFPNSRRSALGLSDDEISKRDFDKIANG